MRISTGSEEKKSDSLNQFKSRYNDGEFLHFRGASYEVISKTHWQYQTEHCQILYSLIGGDIMDVLIKGEVQEADAVKLFEIYRTIHAEYLNGDQKTYMSANIEDVSKVSIAAKRYIDEQAGHNKEYFHLVAFTTSNLTKAMFKFVSFLDAKKYSNWRMTSTREELFSIIFDHRTGMLKGKGELASGSGASFTTSENQNDYRSFDSIPFKRKHLVEEIKKLRNELARLDDQHHDQMDQLLNIIGRITWDKKFSPIQMKRTEDNSFNELYGAINNLQDDIQELIQEKEEIARKEKKLAAVEAAREVITAMTDGVFLYNLKTTRINNVNPACGKLIGIDVEDLEGRSAVELLERFIPSSEKHAIRQLFEEYLRDESHTGIEFKVRHDNGKEIPVFVTASELSNAQGEVESLVVCLKDITPLRDKEKERQLLEEKLVQAQKMEALGTLAGGIAHDFNTIIGTITGYTNIIGRELPEDSVIQEDLKAIANVAGKAADLVKQIRDFSRPSSMEKAPLEFISTVGASLQLIKKIIPSTISIQEEFLEKKLVITANETQINQVLINLCSNASDFIKDKTGVITIRIEKADIKNQSASNQRLQPGRYAKLVLSDTGSGINPDIIDRIFDPYFTTKEFGKGSGLGLSVVHGIISGHDGYIYVESELKKGTTFTIYLPLRESETE